MLASAPDRSMVTAVPAPHEKNWAPLVVIGLFCAMSVLGVAGGAATAKVLRFAYPVGAFVVSVYLYFNSNQHYFSFTWWLWFVSPFVRRLVDIESGWYDPSPILVAPLAATLVSGAALLRNAQMLWSTCMPYGICLTTIAYGLCIALIQAPPASAAIPLLNWLAPLVYGGYLATEWRNYPHLRNIMQRTFVWGTLVMGAYGVFQFLVAPAWDVFWMINVGHGSFGFPEQYLIRVFSTMAAPQSFAVTIMASLLLLLVGGGPLRIPAAIVGYMAFLLTCSRAAWLGWLVGMVVLLLASQRKKALQIGALLAVTGLCVAPLASFGPIADIVGARMGSFSDGRGDVSVMARVEGHVKVMGDAAQHPFGKGIGVMDRDYKTSGDDDRLGPHDSMYLELLMSLGWGGCATYLFAIGLALFTVIRDKTYRVDSFVAVSLAHTVGLIAQFPFESFALSVQGMTFWTFLSLAFASGRYHRHLKSTAGVTTLSSNCQPMA